MKLMTKEIEKALLKSPSVQKTDKVRDSDVIVKYFNPYGAGTWLITEGEKLDNGDWLLFGMCHIFEWEWGTVLLSELQNLKVPPFGLGIERDLYSKGTVAELMR